MGDERQRQRRSCGQQLIKSNNTDLHEYTLYAFSGGRERERETFERNTCRTKIPTNLSILKCVCEAKKKVEAESERRQKTITVNHITPYQRFWGSNLCVSPCAMSVLCVRMFFSSVRCVFACLSVNIIVIIKWDTQRC